VTRYIVIMHLYITAFYCFLMNYFYSIIENHYLSNTVISPVINNQKKQMKQLLFLIFFFFFAVEANCTTYWVTTTNNAGSGSLRTAANQTLSTVGDTIRLDPNLLNNVNTTILLTSPINLGQVVLIGAHNATDTVYISGGGTTRVFNVQDYQIPFSYSAGTVKRTVLDGIYIKDGYHLQTGGAYGGGVFFAGSTPTYFPSSSHQVTQELIIKNCIFKNNYASDWGGAIGLTNNGVGSELKKRVVITNTKFEKNHAAAGGAIGLWFEGSSGFRSRELGVEIEGCTFYDNRGDNEASAIFVKGVAYHSSGTSSSSVTDIYCAVRKSTFYNNNGASSTIKLNISRCKSRLLIKTSTFTNNSGKAIDFYTRSSFKALLGISNSTILGSIDYDVIPMSGQSSSYYNSLGVTSSIVTGYISASPSSYYTNPTYSIFSSSGLNLGLLQNNGGNTLTMLPMLNSSAIDGGKPSDFSDAQNSPVTDNRRDIGAAEFDCSNLIVLNQTICNGDTFYLGNQALTISGSYGDTLTNAAGCDSVVTLNLTINALPTVTASGTATICAGQSTNLTAGGASTYAWCKVSLCANPQALLCFKMAKVGSPVLNSPIKETAASTSNKLLYDNSLP